jgi:hypothetical protein
MIEVIKPKPPWHVLKGVVDPSLCESLGNEIIALRAETYLNESDNPGDPWAEDSFSPNSLVEKKVREEVLNQILTSDLNPCAPYMQVEVDRAWGQVHERGMSTDWHTHGANKWAVVVYLKTPKNCGRLIFQNPLFCLDRDPFIPRTRELDQLVMDEPKVGDWVCFPSWVYHKVSRNLSPELRASYAFNFYPVG